MAHSHLLRPKHGLCAATGVTLSAYVCVRKHNRSMEAHKAAGAEFFQDGAFLKAVGEYSKAIKLAPDEHTLYANRAAALCQLNKFSKAIADGQKCVALKPDWAKGHYRLGSAQLGANKGADAVASLERALELDPSMADIAEFEKALKEAKLSTWNMAHPNGLQVIGDEKVWDSAEAQEDSTASAPLAFAAKAIEAVTESFNAAGATDACAYFPGGSVVGIGKAFEGKDIHGPIAQCTGFLREHAAKIKANCVCVAVQKSRISYPKSWEHQPKKIWKFKEKDGVFIQLETDDANLRRIWFLPQHNGKLMEACMLDENFVTVGPLTPRALMGLPLSIRVLFADLVSACLQIMPSVFHDEALFNDDQK